jgi:hypothetical protein
MRARAVISNRRNRGGGRVVERWSTMRNPPPRSGPLHVPVISTSAGDSSPPAAPPARNDSDGAIALSFRIGATAGGRVAERWSAMRNPLPRSARSSSPHRQGIPRPPPPRPLGMTAMARSRCHFESAQPRGRQGGGAVEREEKSPASERSEFLSTSAGDSSPPPLRPLGMTV